MSDRTKEREEEKRQRAYDPALRWKHIQETIAWAEANLPPELRRNRPRWPRHGRSTTPGTPGRRELEAGGR